MSWTGEAQFAFLLSDAAPPPPETCDLPAYAPDLNPVEALWGNLKGTEPRPVALEFDADRAVRAAGPACSTRMVVDDEVKQGRPRIEWQ